MALHLQSRLVQSTVLNAVRLQYKPIIGYLRQIAEAWKHSKAESVRILEVINEFKLMVKNFTPVWAVWKLILGLEPKASKEMHDEFMRMLYRNGEYI